LRILIAIATLAAPRSEPALEATLTRPDVQVQRVVDLFAGSRFASPAAALSAWKRATRKSLGNAPEVIVALFNPESARELRVLDSTSFSLAFDPLSGAARWFAIAPHDDGSLAAAATALALTDGAQEAPLEDGTPVDRLGPPGSFVVAHSPPRLVLAPTRADLVAVLPREPRRPPGPPLDSGLTVRLYPSRLEGDAAPLERRRVFEALNALNCEQIDAVAGLEGESISIAVISRFNRPNSKLSSRRIDRSWLAGLPSERTAAVFACALDPHPQSWNQVFDTIDRVEKADPARSKVAPTRARLNVLALGVGVRPDVELWPLLVGVSGGVLAGPPGQFEGGWLSLHAIDEKSAEKLATATVPRLLRALRLAEPLGPAPIAGRAIGRLADRDVIVVRDGTRVWLAWGAEALPRAPADGLGKLESMIPNDGAPGQTLNRFAAVWPGRAPVVPTEWAKALAGAAPIVWVGMNAGTVARDEIRVSGLKSAVKNFLEGLPLE
jgi:hypothetical protein